MGARNAGVRHLTRRELEFSAEGALKHAHLERGVEMQSDEVSQPVLRTRRMAR